MDETRARSENPDRVRLFPVPKEFNYWKEANRLGAPLGELLDATSADILFGIKLAQVEEQPVPLAEGEQITLRLNLDDLLSQELAEAVDQLGPERFAVFMTAGLTKFFSRPEHEIRNALDIVRNRKSVESRVA